MTGIAPPTATSLLAAPPDADALRARLQSALAGDYVLQRELGRGGMGAVFLARDLRLDRAVAIKLLPPDLAAHPDLRERFLRETRTAAGFSHPNVVPVHAVEERGGVLCFVMGFVDGETLTQRVRRTGPLNTSDAIRVIQEVAWALSYAHSHGVVHRDIKPDNILLDRATSRALVTDFGIARATNASGLTTIGEVVGTPQYMSPEQASGEAVDARSDLYSLGVTAFFAVTARLPFESDSPQALLAMHITKPANPVGPLRPDLPPAFAETIDRLLAKDPAARFQTGESLADALDALRSSRPTVPTNIRLFQVRANQALRSAVMLLLVAPAFANGSEGIDRYLILTVFAAAAIALVMQVAGTMRDLIVQGLSFDHLKQGLEMMANETLEIRAQLYATPEWVKRRRRVLTIAVVTLVIGIVLIVAAARTRIPRAGGGYYTPFGGLIMVFTGASLAIASIVVAMARSSTPGAADRKMSRVWTGPFGRLMYALATRAASHGASAASPASIGERGPLTLLGQLPKNSRRELQTVERLFSRIESERATLDARERELDAALTDAKRPAAANTGDYSGASEARDRLIDELGGARTAVADRRAQLASGVERMRIELIRAKSGVATASDVRAAIARIDAEITA